MLPILQIGSFALQTPGLILLAGLWFGLSLTEKHAKRFRVKSDKIYNLAFIMFVAGILGARLVVVAQFPAAFIENPLSLVSLNPSLLDPSGGFIIAVVVGLIYGQRKNMALWNTLDALIPALAVIGVAIPMATLASGSAFGQPTNLPWAIDLWGATRHPTQVYQAILASVILWLIWPSRQSKKNAAGMLSLKFLAYSAGARLVVEGFRGDSTLILGGLRSAQLAAWIILAIALWGYFRIESGKER